MKQTALSIRQPWAWLIVNGHKDIENRTWRTNHRGRRLIHAGKGMTRAEYEECLYFCRSIGVLGKDFPVAEGSALNKRLILPHYDELDRGGIVGVAEIVDCITSDEIIPLDFDELPRGGTFDEAEIVDCVSGVRTGLSPWFTGPYGFVLRNAKPLPFAPCKGALGFFSV